MWYQWYHIHKILIAGLGLTPTLSTTALPHQAASREAHIGGSFYGWNGGIEGHETRQVGSTQAQAWKPGLERHSETGTMEMDVSKNSGTPKSSILIGGGFPL